MGLCKCSLYRANNFLTANTINNSMKNNSTQVDQNNYK